MAMFSVHKQTRRKGPRPVPGLGSTARMADGSTRFTVAGPGLAAGGGDEGLGAATGAGTGAGFAAADATGAGGGAAAPRGSVTVFPHLPQELAPPPA